MFVRPSEKIELYSYSHFQIKPLNYPYLFDKYFYQFNYKTYQHSDITPFITYTPLLLDYDKANQEHIETETALETFIFRRQSTIKSFFNSQFVDIPVCFQKSKSLYTLTFEMPLIKTMNILMRSGLRGKVLKVLTTSFHTVLSQMHNSITGSNYIHWTSLHFLLNTLTVNPQGCLKTPTLDRELSLPLFKGDRLDSDNYYKNYKTTTQALFFDNLSKYAPIFSFYIRKVDKSIRKNSRGKSGKYTIIWKYVPVYKRLYVVVRWFLRDLKFQKVKHFDTRFIKILETFLYSPNLSFLVRLRKFVHNFVFYNFKQTLLKHLKSTS